MGNVTSFSKERRPEKCGRKKKKDEVVAELQKPEIAAILHKEWCKAFAEDRKKYARHRWEMCVELIELGRWFEANPERQKHPKEDRNITYGEVIRLAQQLVRKKLHDN